MGSSGAEPTKDRKVFKKFVEIGIGKIKNESLIRNCMNFCADLDKNIRIIENCIRPGGSARRRADHRALASYCDFSLNFPLAILTFSYNSRVVSQDKT